MTAPAAAPPGLTSIVIPAYNAAGTLAAAIGSCFAQGVEGDRLVVVDDGSADATAAVAAGFGDRLRLVRKPNGGASTARNAGLARVETRYVLFLDADDLYEGPFVAGLERAAAAADADIAFGTTQDVAPDGSRARPRQFPPDPADPDAFLAAWLNGHSVPTNSQFWRTAFLRAVGGWNEQIKILEEIEVVARGVLAGARLAVSLDGTSLYRHHATPTRVGYGSSEPVVRSIIEGFLALEPRVGGRAAVRAALGRRLYEQARAAYRLGYDELGHVAIARARALGFAGHAGTRAHRALAALLGLRRKEALARARR